MTKRSLTATLATVEATYRDEYALATARVTALTNAKARADWHKTLEGSKDLARGLGYMRQDGRSPAELIPRWAALIENLRGTATAGTPGPKAGSGLTIDKIRGAIRGLVETGQEPTQAEIAEAVDLTTERVRQVERRHGGHRAIVASVRADTANR